jgi:hypothetical protein
MWEKVKSFGAWVYNWVTVIASVVVGGASYVLQQLELLNAIDFSAVLPPETALKVIVAVGTVKAVCTMLVVFHAWYTGKKPEEVAP